MTLGYLIEVMYGNHFKGLEQGFPIFLVVRTPLPIKISFRTPLRLKISFCTTLRLKISFCTPLRLKISFRTPIFNNCLKKTSSCAFYGLLAHFLSISRTPRSAVPHPRLGTPELIGCVSPWIVFNMYRTHRSTFIKWINRLIYSLDKEIINNSQKSNPRIHVMIALNAGN